MTAICCLQVLCHLQKFVRLLVHVLKFGHSILFDASFFSVPFQEPPSSGVTGGVTRVSMYGTEDLGPGFVAVPQQAYPRELILW